MNRPHKALMESHKFLHSNGLAVALAAAFLVACASEGDRSEQSSDEPKKEYVAFAEYVSEEDSLPRLRFVESGLVSVNDRCAVRKVKLNPKMPPAWVNGSPIGFC